MKPYRCCPPAAPAGAPKTLVVAVICAFALGAIGASIVPAPQKATTSLTSLTTADKPSSQQTQELVLKNALDCSLVVLALLLAVLRSEGMVLGSRRAVHGVRPGATDATRLRNIPFRSPLMSLDLFP